MNNEVIKAMNKKKDSKIKQFKKWWSKNGYKIIRVILFPIWGVVVVDNKIDRYLNSRQKWSEERANEIFNYYIPQRASWAEEDKTFYFFDNGYGWSIYSAKKYLKIKDRRFWQVNNTFCGGKLRRYLIDTFELEGFTKEVKDCYGARTEICFKMIEK